MHPCRDQVRIHLTATLQLQYSHRTKPLFVRLRGARISTSSVQVPLISPGPCKYCFRCGPRPVSRTGVELNQNLEDSPIVGKSENQVEIRKRPERCIAPNFDDAASIKLSNWHQPRLRLIRNATIRHCNHAAVHANRRIRQTRCTM
jgi:hypothetical protein